MFSSGLHRAAALSRSKTQEVEPKREQRFHVKPKCTLKKASDESCNDQAKCDERNKAGNTDEARCLIVQSNDVEYRNAGRKKSRR